MVLNRKEAKVCDMDTFFTTAEGPINSTGWMKTARFWQRLGWVRDRLGYMFAQARITTDTINDSLSMVLGGDDGGEN